MKLLPSLLCLVALASWAFPADREIDSLLEQSRVLRKSNKPTQAKPFAERAMNLALSKGAWDQLYVARIELSFDERLVGNYDRVLELRLENLETVHTHNGAFSRGEEENAFHQVCAAYSWKKDYPQAVKYCRQSLAVTPDEGVGPAHAHQALGINLYLAGKYAEAEGELREAYAGYVAFAQLFKNTQVSSTYEMQVEVLRWLERVLISQNRIEEALETAELGRSQALAAALSGGDMALPSMRPNQAARLAREYAHEQHVTIVEYSVLYEYDPDVLFIFGGFDDTPVSSIYVWVIQPSGKILFHESKPPSNGPSFAETVRQAHSASSDYTRSVTISSEVASAQVHPLEDLQQILINPIAADLPHDPAQIVTFVLQDWLFLVPFASLRDPGGHYLIENHTIAETPSLAVLDLTHQESRPSGRGQGALVIGNPIMPSIAVQEGGTPYQLSSLPGAEQEARVVASRFHATPLIGISATKDQVLRRLPNAQIAHFATHGLLDEKTSGHQSALVLSPGDGDSGLLTAREIEHLRLKADLVVLSACNTALGKMSGDGIFGLSRSFLTAGVPSVVVSLWAISDQSTAYLMGHFYQRIQNGENKASALRGAMLDTMKSYPSPLGWGAFVLVGETASAPGLRLVTGDADAGSSEMHLSNFAFPLPPNVENLIEDPNPEFGGTTSSVTYSTHLGLKELVDFYKHELEKLGLKEDQALENIDSRQFSLVYRGPWGDREAHLSAVEFSNSLRFVSLGFEVRRDDDSEFSSAASEKRSGLAIPEHATGLRVDTRFDFSKGEGSVTFLSKMPPDELRAYYREILERSGFKESAYHQDERGAVDCEFRGSLDRHVLVLHVGKSFQHPERMEVEIHYDKTKD